MKRTLIIAIVVVLVLAFGGGLVLLLTNRSGSTATKNNRNTGRVVSTNATNTGSAADAVVRQDKGSIDLGKALTYRGTTLEFTTADSFDSFHGLSRQEGERFVVLFLKPVQGNEPAVQSWLASDVKLRAADGTESPLRSYELVGPQANIDTGFLVFNVPRAAQHFTLIFSATGQTTASLDLGF